MNGIVQGVVGTNINITATVVLLLCTALVLFMVPGLAIFYGGLTRRKNVVTIIAQCFISSTIVTLIWIFGGFSLAFGTTAGGFIGNPADYFFFRNIIFTNGWGDLALVVNTNFANGVPFIAFFLFQLAFAIITPALVTGAFADRLKYRGYILFTILFTLFIYIPVCHWVWGGGFLMTNGAIDWAGGVVIHATCGMAAITSVLLLKKREILSNETTTPHSLPLVSIGAAILFFGWFGFNVGGSTYIPGASMPDATKILSVGIAAFANSFIAMVSATAIWTIVDYITKKHTTLTGILTAGVAGLATITPTAGFVPIWSSLVIGFVGGLICYLMCRLNHKTGFDDALEVWPVHGVGGVVGSILVAAFATPWINPFILPSFVTSMGSGLLLGWQLAMISVVCLWTGVFSYGIFYLLIKLGCKADNQQQIDGLDNVLFGENAYSKGIIKETPNNVVVKTKNNNNKN